MFAHLTQGLQNTETPPPFFVIVQINLKIYSFQAAARNKVIAKNAFVPDIYISIKSSASNGTQFFA